MAFHYATAELFFNDSGTVRLEMGGQVWLDSCCGFDCEQPDERECEVYLPGDAGLADEEMLRIGYNPRTRCVLWVLRTRHVPPPNPGGSGDWDTVEFVEQPGITIVGDITEAPHDEDDDE